MARGKVGTILIKMLSTAGTGFFYVKARARSRRGAARRALPLWRATLALGARRRGAQRADARIARRRAEEEPQEADAQVGVHEV
jgi:hypothetical protein